MFVFCENIENYTIKIRIQFNQYKEIDSYILIHIFFVKIRFKLYLIIIKSLLYSYMCVQRGCIELMKYSWKYKAVIILALLEMGT